MIQLWPAVLEMRLPIMQRPVLRSMLLRLQTIKIYFPVLFVCEDNGIGISTRTPKNWLSHRCSHPSIKYFNANGLDVIDALETADQAVSFVRRFRKPAILHINVIRLLGHAGSDVEQPIEYRN